MEPQFIRRGACVMDNECIDCRVCETVIVVVVTCSFVMSKSQTVQSWSKRLAQGCVIVAQSGRGGEFPQPFHPFLRIHICKSQLAKTDPLARARVWLSNGSLAVSGGGSV